MQLAEIHFTVDGVRYEFEPPTPRLAFKASRLFGGLGAVADRCESGDLDIYAGLLRLACPAAAKMTENQREEFIFANLQEVNIACTRWALALQWGGREPHQVEADREKAGDAADGSAEGNGEAAPVAEEIAESR